MEMKKLITEVTHTEEMDFLGVADLSLAHDAIEAQGGPNISRFPRAIAIGKTLIHSIVDDLSDPPELRSAALYRYYCYDLVNDRLDKAALRISTIVQAAGFDALPVPAAPRAVDNEKLCGIFSSKMAAHLAGLGWIGKSCLLVTPEAGPRVRWASVLTDAPLAPSGTPAADRCRDCRICVDTCPAKAFTGQPFTMSEGREARFDAFACNRYQQSMKDKLGMRVCGLCVKVCPHGRKITQNQLISHEA
jgi:epoxyqueuosine reductase